MVLVGIAGGSGAGKTTVAQAITERIGEARVNYIHHNSYYRDLGSLPLETRATVNLDHPDAFETALLTTHLRQLRAGQPVDVPTYDFTTYTRRSEIRPIVPRPLLLVEGILILADKALRALLDIRVFLDTDADLRFIRRLQRDVHERGRTIESVAQQYLGTVRPMHLGFVEPSKRYADIIVPEGGHNIKAVEMIVARLEKMIGPENQTR